MSSFDHGPEHSAPRPTPDNPSLEDVFVAVPCFEPAGLVIELTGQDLSRHSLLLGQTGSGKTVVLRRFVKELIFRHAASTSHRPAIFIFDLNGDDTVPLIRKWSREAGREQDLHLLTAREGYFDIFSDITRLEDLSTATSHFMHGVWLRDPDIGYWMETCRSLLDAALGICLIVTGGLEINSVLRFISSWLIAYRPTAEDLALLRSFAEIAERAQEHSIVVAGKLQLIAATIEMWATLDTRTRGIVRTCLLNVVGGLIAPETRSYLDPSRGNPFAPEAITEGGIMVFSLPAAIYPEAAALLGKILKARLFQALQSRPQGGNERLCVIFADEYHYLASGVGSRASDVTALATLRSRGVGFIAATQSLDHLASVLSPGDFRSLVPNFGSQFFFRSTERSTSEFAAMVMGVRPSASYNPDYYHSSWEPSRHHTRFESVCPIGALSALSPGEAYVSIADGYRSPGALWLAGIMESAPTRPDKVKNPDDSWQKLREQFIRPEHEPTSVPKESIGFLAPSDLPCSLEDWERVIQFPRFRQTAYISFANLEKAFANMNQYPKGLETLPASWCLALVRMIRVFLSQHPIRLIILRQDQGCLNIAMEGSGSSNISRWMAQLQRSVYPSRHRPLKARDQGGRKNK